MQFRRLSVTANTLLERLVDMIVVTEAAGQVGTELIKTLHKQNRRIKATVTPNDDVTPTIFLHLKQFDRQKST